MIICDLVLPNVTLEPSNVRKNNDITKYDKSIIKCDIGTTQCDVVIAQCDNKTIKYEKKIRVLLNVTKI